MIDSTTDAVKLVDVDNELLVMVKERVVTSPVKVRLQRLDREGADLQYVRPHNSYCEAT